MRDATPWHPPTQFDEYRLVRPVGLGSSGLVFLAQDTLLERAVAVKFLPASDRAALGRFLNEARAAARLQHPNVVTLYRVGQVQDRAYLVTEYTPGVSLDRVKKPLPVERALEVGRQLARGLAAAHRKGVLHRDLKPGNVIVTETGQVKLLDFGLAKLLEREVDAASALELEPGPEERPFPSPVGTPYYMPPEAWGIEEHTARSDLYSLGAVLYELCCGRAPFRHVPFAALAETVRGQEAPPLREVAPEVDGALAAVVERCLRRTPAERYASAEEVLDALEQVGTAEPRLPVPEGNPYRGLGAFDAEHRALFFGRAREVRAVVERLCSDGFVLLTGDSGVGKSSLCAAGVLPALADGALGDERRWEARRMVPGRRPLTALALALAPVWGESTEALGALSAEPEALARGLRERVGARAGLVLYVDQLEELVTLCASEEAHRFAEVLAPLARGLPGVRLVATARSDFLTRLAGLPGLGRLVAGALHLVPPLGPEEVREAVVGPARAKGVRFESEALVATLVDSTVAAGGGLPLLQFALAQLWEGRARERDVIPAAALDALGGVAGALARHADGVVEALPAEQQRAARGLLLRLVTDDGTRARRGADELCGEDACYRAALEALVRGRLLVAREAVEGSTFEVAHEALLSGWDTLARWLAEEAETREVRKRLEATAREWERTGYSAEALWGERALRESEVLEPASLPERERRFLDASRAELRRRRRRRQALVAGFALSLLAAVGLVRLRGVLERERAADAELTVARDHLDAAARAAEAQARAEQESFRAFDTGQLQAAEGAWAEARRQAEEADARQARLGEALERALALAPERRDVRRLLSDALLTRAARAEASSQEGLRDVLASRLRLVDAEGEHWARWSAPALLDVTRPPEGRLRVRRYVPRSGGALGLEEVPDAAGDSPLRLPAGSYLLTLEAPGAAEVRLPVSLGRGERRQVRLRPPPAETPPGFVYVPPGRFLFGSAAAESVRQFFNAAPQHPVETEGYFIGRHEVTWAEYLAFLEALPPQRREEHLPRAGSTGMYGSLELSRGTDGRWTLAIQPTTQRLVARQGERLRYPGRRVRAEVAWERLPVVGIRYADARAYAAWLDATGRVPGARLCTELEWERAARGADGREYPHGNRLLPDEANFDLTYGKEPLAFGPDEVGSHPASASPFGVEDLAGNVWEWTDSVHDPGRPVARGSSYYFSASTCRATNREAPEASFRDPTVGMRLCASLPGATASNP
ncbi:bifunctional serine/threonine-protein kinase/formylglycine-generating enzyme family protein [Pyxidicoccus fallax]|uniref:bifunctional serine/threonine-protein kinase/formylglycine-generating enzyme family protein n=1 Tax=Pyxidicoccus fallax TaxID=394095 RepID=UPI001B7D6E79|nr:bifunctional serine/threonine-protein kinase/formylglycine-generating enzyme family protein [Pyxidicoccus fallax]